jgi:hypothetical protein
VMRIRELAITLAMTSNRSTLEIFCSMLHLLVTANVVPNSQILVTLMTEVIRSSETSLLTRTTRRNIQYDDILHSHRHENLTSYIELTSWTL